MVWLGMLWLLTGGGRPVWGATWSWFAVPSVAYDTDDRFGIGGRAELNRIAEGLTPYQTAWVVQLYASTNGFHHHRFRYDRLGLGPQDRWRLTAHFAWRQWNNDGYWGIGNGTTREETYARTFAPDDPARKRYLYTLRQPFSHIALQRDLTDAWRLFTGVSSRYSLVETYPGSLLEAQQPYGIAGGLTVAPLLGLIYDTREPELNPSQGRYLEVSGRVALPLPGSAGTFGGPFASLRGYRALDAENRVILAGRLMAERLYGQIPFYELVHWGGCWPVAGFGGFETLRGVKFGRWRAPGKAVFNAEARLVPLRLYLPDGRLDAQLVPYLDVGAVWGAQEDATAPAPDTPLHYALGVGSRLVYADRFVGRIDAGWGPDPVLQEDGTIVDEWRFGLYFVFDHAF